MNKHKPSSRSGTILICVLACLLVAMSLIATAIQLSLRARRECRISQQLMQTDLLVEAGIMRAREQLQRSPDYRGETWQPSNTGLAERLTLDSTEVTITIVVEAITNDTQPAVDERQITVTAQLGSTSPTLRSTQRSQRLTLNLPQLSSAE